MDQYDQQINDQHQYVVIQNSNFGAFLNRNQEAFYEAVRVNDTNIDLDFKSDGKQHFEQQVNNGLGVVHDEAERNEDAPCWICDVHGNDEESVQETITNITDMDGIADSVDEVRHSLPLKRELMVTLWDEWVANPNQPDEEQAEDF